MLQYKQSKCPKGLINLRQFITWIGDDQLSCNIFWGRCPLGNIFVSFPLLSTTARLAQSVEHETLNLRVVGSSPTLGDHPFSLQSESIAIWGSITFQ